MKSVVKADTKIAHGATNSTDFAAKGSEVSADSQKSEEDKIMKLRKKVPRAPPPEKKDTSTDKCCDFSTLLKAPEGRAMATALNNGNMTPTSPCKKVSEGHLTFGELSYELCEQHLAMFEIYNRESLSFESSEYSGEKIDELSSDAASRA